MRILGQFLLAALLATAAWAEEPVLKEQPLTTVKASISIPDGWFVKEDTDDGVSVYHITLEKVQGDNDPFSVGLILTVTPKVPSRAEMKPSEYAKELLSSGVDDAKDVKKSEDGPFKILSTEYSVDSDPGGDNSPTKSNDGLKMINVAKANDSTGTLYFITWENPSKDDAKYVDLRTKILASLKLDPTF
ncbi:hypothetical protein BH09VER1_BH09VER1_37640 [soil metagenome]